MHQIVRNAPKHQFRVQWGGSGAFGAKNSDATSFSNFCTSSARFAPSFVRQPNGPEFTQWYETHQNISLGANGVDRVRSLRKIPTRLCGTNLCTSSARFAPSFVRQPNGSKCTQIVRIAENISLGSNGVDRAHSLRKIPMQLRGEKFRHDFVARTFALVQPVLHQVS